MTLHTKCSPGHPVLRQLVGALNLMVLDSIVSLLKPFLNINRFYFLEQFQVYRKIEQTVQKMPIYPPHPLHTIFPSINILLPCETFVITEGSILIDY